MGKTWSDAAVRNLSNWAQCPRCDRGTLEAGWCPNCGADLTSPIAVELATASRVAVEALEARQALLEQLPTLQREAYVPPAYAAPVAAAPVRVAAPAAQATESQISVQSVLAVAGAGLVAIAAIVFTFFNESLTDLTTRSVTVAIISIVFLGAAWLLARGGLQFSAEAVGALAMVFVVLDVWAISTAPHAGLSDYGVAAIATAVASGLMVALASIRRLRTWLWAGLVGLALTPLLLGLAIDNRWSIALGWLGLAFAALLTHELARRLTARFESPLRADHATATALQFFATVVVIGLMFTLPAETDAVRVASISAILAALTLLALLSARNGLAPVWSFIAGAFATIAIAILPLMQQYASDEWILAVVPAAAAGTLAIIATLSRLGASAEQPVLHRTALLSGSLSITALAIAPAGVIAMGQLVTVGNDSFDAPVVLAAIIAGTAVALAVLVVAVARRSSVFGAISLSIGLFAVITMATWVGFSEVVRVSAALAVAVLLVPVVTSIAAVRTAPRRYRVPVFAAAHVLIALAAILTRHDTLLGVFGGIAVVAAIAALTVAMPRLAQPIYAAVAFAYGLAVFAYTLVSYTVLSEFAVIGLTTALALLVALAVTVAKRVAAPFWYAALTVAALPFVVSVGSMLFTISGWVGLSTGVSLLLFVTLVVIHRSGHHGILRAGAASLLLPGLAVVVISLVAQFAEQSASPITLPIVAGLVAATLPCTTLIGRLLVARGHSETDAAAVRLALEISALVTGALAVLLAVVRAAAGFDTTFLVLVIVGLGAAATGQFVHRRYAWYVAFVSFTGALWALLALNTVTQLEPYVLPPALAAAAIGAIAVWRGRNGLGFYAAGLAVAAATPLLVLATIGNGAGTVEWRAYGLLAGALLLVVAGLVLARVAKLARLREATLFVGLGAASAGLVQAVRYGSGRDLSSVGSGELVMVPVLLFSLVAAAIATAAALLLARSPRLASSRWLFVAPMVYLALGPITAFRHGHVYSWTLLILMLALLAVMLLTVVWSRTRAVSLPPVWLTFAIATVVGIAGWSEHTVFRVEAYSLPLGFALLAAGIIAWHTDADAEPSINRWPIGYSGSWWLLAPGILVVLATSIMSTGTDPQTWRAILVIALALLAILLGNRLRLAAPFFLGVAALPLENLVVFAVQIGDKIEATTWWITLASAGAVLLVLAVSSERRASGENGVAARLRDLQ